MIAEEVADHPPEGDEPENMRSLARLGGMTAIAGTVVLFVSTLLHPLDSDPSVPRAAFAEYAADSMWVWTHLGQFLGVAVVGVALVALAGTLAGRAVIWGRIGLVGPAAGVAVAAALQAVDGVALKVMVDRWAAATEEAQALAFEAALAVRQMRSVWRASSASSWASPWRSSVSRSSAAPAIPPGWERSACSGVWGSSRPGQRKDPRASPRWP